MLFEPAGHGAMHDFYAPATEPALQFGGSGAGTVQGQEFAGVSVQAGLNVTAAADGLRLFAERGQLCLRVKIHIEFRAL